MTELTPEQRDCLLSDVAVIKVQTKGTQDNVDSLLATRRDTIAEITSMKEHIASLNANVESLDKKSTVVHDFVVEQAEFNRQIRYQLWDNDGCSKIESHGNRLEVIERNMWWIWKVLGLVGTLLVGTFVAHLFGAHF